MFKFFYFLWIYIVVAVLPLSALEENLKIEVTATSLSTTKDIVYANDGVVVYYDNSVINATRATFNKTTKLLVLDGDVEMIGYLGTKEHTTHMEIQTDTKEVVFEKLFLASQNDLWLLSDKAHRTKGQYTFGESMLSSCDVNNPLWKMAFSHANYDSIEEYMKVYHAKIYFGSIPVFYTPYLAFSTNKERSSGLLFPLFGYVADEGMIYEQPIFWNISPSMDLQINPQIRTRRNVGLYSTFRFVDSNHSKGKIRVGYFKDSEAYQKREKTKELKHYGAEFLYESSELFSQNFSKEVKDGLLIDLTYLNDVDYLYLQKKPIHFGLTPKQESRINYFLHDNEYYMGLNAKYIIDIRKENNDKELQILPRLQLHKYLNHLVWDNLTYSIDLQTSNFNRKEGLTLQQIEFTVPLTWTMSLFDDYLNISLGEKFYYRKYLFANETLKYDNFQYYNNIHQASIFTNLTKKYTNFVHVIQPTIEYIRPGSENESPIGFDALNTIQKPFVEAGLPQEQYRIGFNQYFYDNDKTTLKFFQRFYQNYYPQKDYKWSDLGNEMQYNWEKWSLYSNLIYAPKFSKIREATTGIFVRKDAYTFYATHSYKKVLENAKKPALANDIILDFSYVYNNRISIFGGFTYNLDAESSKQWKLGGGYNRDCWGITGSLRQDIRPTANGVKKDNTFYIQLDFKPFASMGVSRKEIDENR